MLNAPRTQLVPPQRRRADALYAAAVGLWREQQRDEAIKLMDEALRLRSDFPEALCMGGHAERMRQPDAAMVRSSRASARRLACGRACQLRQAPVRR